MNLVVPVHCSDFRPSSPWAHLNGDKHEEFRWASILRAAVVAGYPDLKSIPSRRFARWRAAALRLAIRRRGNELVRPPEWRDFDGSEKATVSSLLGVAVTKLLTERFLKAPILLFLDVHFIVNYTPRTGRLRPDFVAFTRGGNAFAVEAKGRSKFRWTTMNKAKGQAAALGKVNGKPVKAAIACVTSFPVDKLEARFADPEPDEGEPKEAKISAEEALHNYQTGVLRFREFSTPSNALLDTSDGTEVRLWHSEELDFDLGLLPRIGDSFESLNQVDAEQNLAAQLIENGGELGPDGVIIILGRSWREHTDKP